MPWVSATMTPKARHPAALRNWTSFGAPLAGVVCIRCELGLADSLGVEIVREQLGIGDEMRILCGLAVGLQRPGFSREYCSVSPQRGRVS